MCLGLFRYNTLEVQCCKESSPFLSPVTEEFCTPDEWGFFPHQAVLQHQGVSYNSGRFWHCLLGSVICWSIPQSSRKQCTTWMTRLLQRLQLGNSQMGDGRSAGYGEGARDFMLGTLPSQPGNSEPSGLGFFYICAIMQHDWLNQWPF